MTRLLEIRDLSIAFGDTTVARNIGFTIDAGETLALVGESGSGKTVTALSIPQLLPYPYASHPSGSILLEGQEMVGANRARLLAARGAVVTMIFQEPMTSLNPLHKIGKQVAETLIVYGKQTPKQASARVQELFELVGLAGDVRADAYPHELSGGQRQRVMIAMALALEPKLLIADEPTTALDVIIQKQILELLCDLQQRLNMALLLISHDLTVVRSLAKRICVMTNGEIVEEGTTEQIFSAPKHTYTKHLLGAEFMDLPAAAKKDGQVVAEIEDLRVNYSLGRHWFGKQNYLQAVRGVSLKVHEGQTIGIVGESGSGKTTLGRAILRLIPSEGRIVAIGRELHGLNHKQMKPLRQDLQIVFQDPYGSLSPRMTVGRIVDRGLRIHHPEMSAESRDKRVAEALEEVGLSPDMMGRYPHEFSGGQRQRISIARALIVEPKLIVMDEPTSSLDVSVQAQIVELLRDLQKSHDLVYLFISHDLKVVRALAHYLVVMRNGVVVEQGPAAEIFNSPSSAYTRALMAAAFIPQVEAQAARNAALGNRFQTRSSAQIMAEINVKNALAPRGIVHDPEHCTGCGLCELMCSLYHEGEQGQALSRGELVGDRLTAEFTFNVCWQCPSPACHEACPLKDEALVIDELTGTKYIDPDVCYGCGDCIDACALDPPRIRPYPEKNVVLMCDLCRGRPAGPICVEYCSFDALKIAIPETR